MVYYTIEDDPTEKHVDAVLTAMESHGTIKHTIVQGIFVGPARSGKNCLMERLLHRVPPRVSPSTGVADSVIKVNYKTERNSVISAVAHIHGTKWAIMDDDDQAVDFLRIFNKKSQPKQKLAPALTLAKEEIPVALGDPLLTAGFCDEIPVKTMCSSSSRSSLVVQLSIPKESDSCLNVFASPNKIFKDAIKKKGSSSLEHVNEASLYLTNTGGQVEFQDVLPLLVSGPSLFFYTFRLDCNLNERYEVIHELSEEKRSKTYTYKSSVTVKEGILQTLASIASMATYVYHGKEREVLKPKVFLVGTHKDQLANKSMIEDIEKELKDAIKPHIDREIVEYASESELIFALNNFSEGDSTFHKIRHRVHELLKREKYKMEFPSHWLAYSFAIKKIEPQITSIDHCFKIAKQCGIYTEEELKQTLCFLHSATGLIRYFPFSELENIVIVHPQFLFDKVTELIVSTFTFDKVGHSKKEKFRKSGVFSVKDFEKVSANCAMFHPKGLITAKQFGKILERLRIAAPFEENEEIMYFLPCVLGHANVSKLDTTSEIPGLLVSFECGYCPKGVAGALIKYLMANEMHSTFHWKLLKDKIFRDEASFHVGPHDTLVIKHFATHMEMTCIPGTKFKSRKCTVTETCRNVREAVEAGIRQVLRDMNYVEVKHSFTFLCPKCCVKHPAQVIYYNGQPGSLECSNVEEVFELPSGCEIWDLGDHRPIVTSFFYQLQEYAAEWYRIGVQLNISTGVLDIIKDTYFDIPDRFKEMLKKWFESPFTTSNQKRLEELKLALSCEAVGLQVAAQGLHLP